MHCLLLILSTRELKFIVGKSYHASDLGSGNACLVI